MTNIITFLVAGIINLFSYLLSSSIWHIPHAGITSSEGNENVGFFLHTIIDPAIEFKSKAGKQNKQAIAVQRNKTAQCSTFVSGSI